MEKRDLIYEGKAKQIYATDQQDQLILHFKDDATAFNGVKKALIEHKGSLNNWISTYIFHYLMDCGIKTHYIKTLNDTDQLCLRVEIIPLEVIVRNIVAGSMAKRLDLEEGMIAHKPIFELCYKNDHLNDPLINEDHAIILGLASETELALIKETTMIINQHLIRLFDKIQIDLVDFKIEFGRLPTGELVLADEISPDSCRLWDQTTRQKMDKDRFRRDLGHVIDAYQEIYRRLKENFNV